MNQKIVEITASSNNNYIVNMTGSSSGKIGIALSDNTCELYSYDSSSLRKVSALTGQKCSITDIKFNPIDDNQIFFSSEDGSIKMWDPRTEQKFAEIYEENPATRESVKPLNSFDICRNGKMLCGGTELVQNDAFILFWDVRSKQVLGGYWNSHTDDVVQLKFNKDKSNKLISGSVDGLVNVYDISESTEDDALQYSLNVDCAIDKLSWISDAEISCLTQNVDLQLWNVDTADQIKTYTREIISKSTNTNVEDCYVVDVYNLNSEEIVLLAGSYDDERNGLKTSRSSNGALVPHSTFEDNKQIVRCSWCDFKGKVVATGGEMGILSLWKYSQSNGDKENFEQSKKSNLISSVTKKNAIHRKKPYCK